MELRHLRYFVAVAETGSLTVAATTRLRTAQPSLSRQIRDLEDEVGVSLFARSARGVALTDAGRAFIDHARLALHQVDAAVEAARRAAQPSRERFALGFLTGQELTWLPKAMRLLHSELSSVDVGISSNYSPDLAEAVARGRLDVAFMRAEPGFDLTYRVVEREALVVLMPSDHHLAAKNTIRPRDLAGESLIAMSGKAKVLRATIDAYLAASGVSMEVAQQVDNPAMVMSLVASTRAVSLIPAYVENLMPWSVVSRKLAAPTPTIDLVVGYSASNKSPLLQAFLRRFDELAPASARTPPCENARPST